MGKYITSSGILIIQACSKALLKITGKIAKP